MSEYHPVLGAKMVIVRDLGWSLDYLEDQVRRAYINDNETKVNDLSLESIPNEPLPVKATCVPTGGFMSIINFNWLMAEWERAEKFNKTADPKIGYITLATFQLIDYVEVDKNTGLVKSGGGFPWGILIKETYPTKAFEAIHNSGASRRLYFHYSFENMFRNIEKSWVGLRPDYDDVKMDSRKQLEIAYYCINPQPN